MFLLLHSLTTNSNILHSLITNRNPINNPTHLQCLIKLLQHDPQDQRRSNRNQNRNRIHHKCRDKPWGILIQVHITNIDTRRITHRVNQRQGRRTFRWRSRQGIRDPSQPDDVAGIAPRRHEHHSEISRAKRGGCCGNDERDEAEAEGDCDVEETFTSAVCVEGVKERSDDGEDIGWDGQKEGLDVTFVERCDDLQG